MALTYPKKMLAKMAIPQQIMTVKLPMVCSLVATALFSLVIGSFGFLRSSSVGISCSSSSVTGTVTVLLVVVAPIGVKMLLLVDAVFLASAVLTFGVNTNPLYSLSE